MSDVIKFTEEEMQEIASLQAKYQQKILNHHQSIPVSSIIFF